MTRARNVADIIKQPFTTTLGTSNYRAGVNAGNSITANTNFNVCIGDEAGTALNGGDENVFVGYNAGLANSTGSSNVAIGRAALVGNVGGTRNTAIGDASLASASGSDNNVAVGRASGLNCTGGNNTFIGTDAGEMATSADSSTFVGAFAGQGITGAKLTGNQNTAVGKDAGTLLQGAAADNSLFGFGAGKAITTNTGNTLIGKEAGDAITGQDNVMVGHLAGTFGSDDVTSGAGNVLIGPYMASTDGTDNFAHGLGYNLDCAPDFTTLGQGGSDIRAAHGTATWNTVSDARYKKDIVDSTAGLSFINALQPRTFKYKNLGELPETFRAYEADSTDVFKNSDTNHGFIAQEVKAAIDADSSLKDGFRLWGERADGSQEIGEAALIPMLTKAVQELSTALDAALARIATLEG